MKNFFKELKDYLFYGEPEGTIYNKRPFIQVDREWSFENPDVIVVTLSKTVHFLGKDRIILKDVMVNTNVAKKLNIGDYYVYKEI